MENNKIVLNYYNKKIIKLLNNLFLRLMIKLFF